MAKANILASSKSDNPGIQDCPKPCECSYLKIAPFGVKVSCGGRKLKTVSAWTIPASTTVLYVYFCYDYILQLTISKTDTVGTDPNSTVRLREVPA